MQAIHRTLIALALGAAVATPAAFAQATAVRGAAPTLKTQADAKASDAISARATLQETQPAPVVGSAMLAAASQASAGVNPGKGNWWTDADSDADGKLSVTEATANAGLNARFATIDADKDGFVTQDEYRSYFTANASQGEQQAASNSPVVSRGLWIRLDADADSRLSLAEAAGNARLSTSFTTMDGNGDGFLTQAEYTTYTTLHR